jgi:predicted NodU family carbamoyl transferase
MKVLGISPCHDSSVALIDNGEIKYFCKEERLTRKKREDFTIKSLFEAIKIAKNKIDFVVMCSPYTDNSTNLDLEINSTNIHEIICSWTPIRHGRCRTRRIL